MMARLLPRFAALLTGLTFVLLAPTVAGAAQFSGISAGGRATCAVKANGTLYCWGDGREGQLGRVQANVAKVPVRVVGTYDSRMVSSGTDYGCQIVERGLQIGVSGIVACFGGNDSGQIGNGQTSRAQYPQELRAPDGLVKVAAGTRTTCVLTGGGDVWCWGDNAVGQFGDASDSGIASTTPVHVGAVHGMVDLAVSEKHVCGIRGVGGGLVCWGWAEAGRIGIDSPVLVRPTVVPGFEQGVAQVAVGLAHTCVLRSDSTVWCFGQNDHGQVGIGGAPSPAVPTPTKVEGLPPMIKIAAGGLSTCGVDTGGGAWCWGDGHQGKLGNGTEADSSVPVHVSDVTDVAQITVGDNHVCVLTSAGAPYCWGSNRFGQIGNGDRTGAGVYVRTPTRVVDTPLSRATFVPRALQSFPTGTAGGVVELRDFVMRKVSTRYACPSKATVMVTAKGRTARRNVTVTRGSSPEICRVSGSPALAKNTLDATVAVISVRGAHLRSASEKLRALRAAD